MSKDTVTLVNIYVKDAVRLNRLKRPRDVVPEKKPGRGRGYSYVELNHEVLKRAVDALERVENEVL